jgi:dTDP-4-dehydrorhamnose 3,5-epimerase
MEEPKLIKTHAFFDARGHFQECYRQSWGVGAFVQDNYSYSKKHVLRGMHFQQNPGQAKLVTVLQGVIFDVVVDLRLHSPTFGTWQAFELDGSHQLLIPAFFAHGFLVLSDEAHVFYKISSPYDPQEEKGFRFDDPEVGIQWPVQHPILSQKDAAAPSFAEVVRC